MKSVDLGKNQQQKTVWMLSMWIVFKNQGVMQSVLLSLLGYTALGHNFHQLWIISTDIF